MSEVRIVGFTGSRHGMTAHQAETLRTLLSHDRWGEIHHGDCVGSDAQAHGIARQMGIAVVVHPPKHWNWRAGLEGDKTFPPSGYLDRNRDIVNMTDALIATPKSVDGMSVGGTGYTVRYALYIGRPVFVISPNGRVMREESVRQCLNV